MVVNSAIMALLACSTVIVGAIPNGRNINNCDCVCGIRGRHNRIVGGQLSNINELPWLAALFRQGKVYCGATLVSNKFVLTAAHCVEGIEASEIRVLLGGTNISKEYTDIRRATSITAHENFDILSFNNDVALIELDKPVQFGATVQPACLPDGETTDFAGSLAVVAGWGRTDEKRPPSRVLRSVVVPVWSQDQCLDAGYANNRITGNMMCAGYHDGKKDACQGDSGGPMLGEGVTGSMEVIGVVSWGRGCARPNLPGIYTRIVNYLPWIHEKLNGQCLCQPKNGERTNFLERMQTEE